MEFVVGDKIVAVLFAGLLVAGAVTGFLMYRLMEANDPDPAQQSHTYIMAGTMGGALCNGTGLSEYADETSRDHIYNITVHLASSDSRRDLSFGIAFDSNGSPKTELYANQGEDVVNGENIGIWSYTEKGITYTFYTGKDCTIQKMVLKSTEMDITGTMDGGVYS